MSSKNLLICHIMQDLRNEIGITKTKRHAQEFQWRKRMFPIDRDAIWNDKKGIGHLMCEVNESDGTIRFIYEKKTNIVDDKCVECGGKISIDARNVYDLLKRKTINAIWGIDNSYITLLLIMAVVLVILMGVLFFVIGTLQTTQEQLNKYLPKPEDIKKTSHSIDTNSEVLVHV